MTRLDSPEPLGGPEPAGAGAEHAITSVQVAADVISPTCEDCDVVLTQDNTRVSPQEAYWLGVDWTSEQFCEDCKDRREADGPAELSINYDPPDTTWYREQLRMAGRGHLLG